MEDRHHTFFGCLLSRDTWNTIGLGLLSTVDDTDVWTLPTAVQQDPATLPSILLTILWRLWEARNSTIFRSERHLAREVIGRICDDLTIWEGRFSASSMIPRLR